VAVEKKVRITERFFDNYYNRLLKTIAFDNTVLLAEPEETPPSSAKLLTDHA